MRLPALHAFAAVPLVLPAHTAPERLVSVNRTQLAAGWFVTPALLAKLEWVTQTYNDFPVNDIRSGGKFKGFMFEGVVAF